MMSAARQTRNATTVTAVAIAMRRRSLDQDQAYSAPATAIAVRIAPIAMSHGGGAYIRSPPRVVGLRWYKLRESVSLPPDRRSSLRELAAYFLRLGAIGFGGPAALVGYMRKDLVEERKVVTEQTYNLALALAQIMPGPLAAQTAIAIGYFEHGVAGATLVGLAFILPSFAMVIAISWLYVAYGGLPVMQALFYGIGAVVIAIVAVAAYRLARGTNKRDPLLWAVFVVLLVATVWAQAELAELFLAAGIMVLAVRAPPRFFPQRARIGMLVPAGLLASVSPTVGSWTGNVLVD